MNGLYVRPVHLFEELSGIGGKGFDIAPLSFGEEGIEGEGRLAGTGDSCNDGHFPPRYLAGNILEVMRFGPDDFDKFFH